MMECTPISVPVPGVPNAYYSIAMYECKQVLEEWRCTKCNRVLAHIADVTGTVRVVCKRCKTVNTLEVPK